MSRASGSITTDRLERALRTLALIVAAPDGEIYVPLFERIEAELTQRARQQGARERARAIVARISPTPG